MLFKSFKTYYRVVGEVTEGKVALVLLHGGSGYTHNYFKVLDKIAETDRRVIMNDQIGWGYNEFSPSETLDGYELIGFIIVSGNYSNIQDICLLRKKMKNILKFY